MDFSLLDEMKEKKKYNNTEKNIFSNEINKLIKEEGISDALSDYLIPIVKSNASRTILVWNNSFDNEIQLVNINKLIDIVEKSKCSNSDKFRIYINFIANYLNCVNYNTEILKVLLLRLEPVSYNKEGKRLGDLSKAFKTCFVEKLYDRAKLPELNEIGFERYDYLDSVICLLSEMISSLDDTVNSNSSELVKQNKIRLSGWINEQKKKPKLKLTEPVADNIQKQDISEEVVSRSDEQVAVPVEVKQKHEQNNEKPVFRNTKSRQLYRIALEIDALEEVNNALQDELKIKTEELLKVKKAYEVCASKCQKLADENKEKELVIEEKTKEVFDLKFRIREMSDKITRQADAMGTIKEVHGRETEETLNRIASVLKKYYDDYMSSVDMEMSLDLGENMRDMVEDIFRKLEKNGVNIKGR